MMLSRSREDAPASCPNSCGHEGGGHGLTAFHGVWGLCGIQSAAVGSCEVREESSSSCFGERDEWRGGGSGR